MNMPRLSPDMMARYDIPSHRPPKVNAIQFGLSDILLGTVDRLIDAADVGLGLVCVEAGQTGYARRLNEQAGLYTVVVRGYEGESPVRREQVVQCVLKALPMEDATSLAADPTIELAIVDDDPTARTLAAQFIEARKTVGLPSLPLLSLGDMAGSSVYPLLADCLAFRAEPEDAARECREMNYLDDMLHLAEPHARLTLTLPEPLRQLFPLNQIPEIRFVSEPEMLLEQALHHQVFKAGLFLMIGAGWLNGCDTLHDCMTQPRLREFVGRAFTEELMPALDALPRERLEARVIESFSRYEDPLNRHKLLRCTRGLLLHFVKYLVPVMERWAQSEFEPPRRLSFALASLIMLYAGARLNPSTKRYEVTRGRHTEALEDDPDQLSVFSTLSHDMPPEVLSYAALADRELWNGMDLRRIEGLEARIALDLSAIQRHPSFLPA